MTSARTKRENICDECGLPISICNAKALFEVAVKRNGRAAVIAAILDAKTEQTEQPTPDPVARLVEDEECQRPTELATGAATNGPRGSDANAPAAVTDSYTDAVARLVEAARERDGGAHDPDCRINRRSNPFCNCGHDDLMSALAACKGVRGE